MVSGPVSTCLLVGGSIGFYISVNKNFLGMDSFFIFAICIICAFEDANQFSKGQTLEMYSAVQLHIGAVGLWTGLCFC